RDAARRRVRVAGPADRGGRGGRGLAGRAPMPSPPGENDSPGAGRRWAKPQRRKESTTMSLAPYFTMQQRHGGGRQTLSPRYREMQDINRRFGDLIQTFFGDPTGLIGAAVTPPVDIEETDDAYVVDVDLPSVRPEDVNIEMRGG